MRDCITDMNRCVTCPEIAPTPAVPPVSRTSMNIGWNAGANSIDALDGNLHVAFNAGENEAGLIIGFRAANDSRPPVTPGLISHGWYFFNTGGTWAIPIEAGTQVGTPIAYDSNVRFEVRRVDGVVTYARDGVVTHTSLWNSAGTLRVMACLYAAGDNVP